MEVDKIIDGSLVLDMPEEVDADDCVDEGDEEYEGAYVEQGRQGDQHRHQQFSDSSGSLSINTSTSSRHSPTYSDQSEDAADPEDTEDPEQCGGDGEVGYEVLQDNSEN